jgi:hypothetical protein
MALFSAISLLKESNLDSGFANFGESFVSKMDVQFLLGLFGSIFYYLSEVVTLKIQSYPYQMPLWS